MNTNFMLPGATKLSKSEMKHVKGGSDRCAPGETLYTCTVTYEGGGSFSGLACGRGETDASDKVHAVHDIDGGVNVSCTR